jgi:hypothetical protein
MNRDDRNNVRCEVGINFKSENGEKVKELMKSKQTVKK